MTNRIFFYATILVFSCIYQANPVRISGDEKVNNLLDIFLENTRTIGTTKNTRIYPKPANNSDGPVKVICTMYILDVSKVDDRNMEFTLQMYFRQKWNDQRIIKGFPVLSGSDALKPIILKAEDLDHIWKPDVFFVGEREGQLHRVTVPNTFLKLWPNGDVHTSSRVTLTLPCAMDLQLFPHDTQTCSLNIESYGYKKNELNLEWEFKLNQNPVGIAIPLNLPNFLLTDKDYSAEEVALTTGVYKRLTVELTFQRSIGLYLTKLYLPYLFLVIISMFSFRVSSRHFAMRLSLLLTVLLIMFFYSAEIEKYSPPASYTKAIDVWVAFCLSFVFAAFLEFLYVYQKSRRNSCHNPGKIGTDPENVSPDSDDCFKEKEKASNAPQTNISTSMFVARNLCKTRQWSTHTDLFCGYFFPIAFLVFNIVYWCSYVA